MIFRALPAVLLFAALAACGSNQSTTTPAVAHPSATTAGATAPSPRPSPTPTLLTKQQAALLYLHLVIPANQTTKALNAIMQQPFPDLAAGKSAAAADARALRAFSIAMQNARWPANVQATVDQLVVYVSKQATIERGMSSATTVAALVDAWNEAADAANDGGAAADLIRQKLGLPEPPKVG